MDPFAIQPHGKRKHETKILINISKDVETYFMFLRVQIYKINVDIFSTKSESYKY